jgi:membrane protease subunit (stomatin/prohibitin family)
MFRRRRPLLRAAAVGGTAYVAGRHMGRNAEAQQQAESDQDARIDNLEQQQAPAPAAPAPAAAPAAAGPSLLDQLNQLSALHEQGALTDNEFTAAKAKLLG